MIQMLQNSFNINLIHWCHMTMLRKSFAHKLAHQYSNSKGKPKVPENDKNKHYKLISLSSFPGEYSGNSFQYNESEWELC